MIQNYISLNSPDSCARSSRQAIRTELAGKLVYDNPQVFQRMGLDRVPPDFVDSCTRTFNQSLGYAKAKLLEITNAAAGKSEYILDAEDDDPNQEGKKAEEKKMYPHLVCLFYCINGPLI